MSKLEEITRHQILLAACQQDARDPATPAQDRPLWARIAQTNRRVLRQLGAVA